MTTLRILAAAALAAALAPAASGETVYRCGNAYSSIPCRGAAPLEVSDATSRDQRAEARETVLREQRLGESMARERRAEAATMHPAAASSLGPTPVREAVTVPAKKKPASRHRSRGDSGDDAFVVRVPRVKAAAA